MLNPISEAERVVLCFGLIRYGFLRGHYTARRRELDNLRISDAKLIDDFSSPRIALLCWHSCRIGFVGFLFA